MIFLTLGPDRLLARQAALAIAAEADSQGANTSWLDGRETPPSQIMQAIGSASFFGEPRVVIVSHLISRARGDATAVETESSGVDRTAEEADGLAALIAAVPDAHALILFEPTLSAAPAKFKSMAPNAKIVAGEPPRGSALIGWIIESAKRAGADIDRRSAQFLAETLFPQTWNRKPNNPRFDRPPDMALLSQEIEKLAVAAYPHSISVEDIVSLTAGGADERIFRFVEAAVTGDLRSATVELERLAAAGEEPAMLLSQVLGQIELAAVTAAAGEREPAAVAKDLGSVTAGRVAAVMAGARHRSNRDNSSVAIGARADRLLKSGRLRQPIDALHHVMLGDAGDDRERETGR